MKFKDLSGQKFGRLTALYRLHNYHKKCTYWLCICDCGNLKIIKYIHLTSGHTKSCGCLQKEIVYKQSTKHGLEGTRLYNTYYNMRSRCYNKNNKEYKNYGGRGITICDEWLNDFMAFYNWSINNHYQENLTIDRIDNDVGYSPSNCRWVNNTSQQRNKRNNNIITINNESHCLSEWCELLKIKRDTVYKRLKYGWDIYKALNYGKV